MNAFGWEQGRERIWMQPCATTAAACLQRQRRRAAAQHREEKGQVQQPHMLQ